MSCRSNWAIERICAPVKFTNGLPVENCGEFYPVYPAATSGIVYMALSAEKLETVNPGSHLRLASCHQAALPLLNGAVENIFRIGDACFELYTQPGQRVIKIVANPLLIETRGMILLAQLLPAAVQRHRQMPIDGLLIAENSHQPDLSGGGIQKIHAPQHMGDTLIAVINDNRELIGIQTIFSAHNKVAHFRIQALSLHALKKIVELNLGVIGKMEAHRGALGLNLIATIAATTVNATHIANDLTTAVAVVGNPFFKKAMQNFLITLVTLALKNHCGIPEKTVIFQLPENLGRRSRHFPRRIQILHANQPFAAMGTGIQVTHQGGNQ